MSVTFTRGPHTIAVSSKLFAENRRRLCATLLKAGLPAKSVVLLEGGVEKTRYNTDAEDLPFRQESYFFWAFGVHESEFYGAIQVGTGRSILFAPKLDPAYAIWQGKINPPQYFTDLYGVDETKLNVDNAIEQTLTQLGADPVLLLEADNSDSGLILPPAKFTGIENLHTNKDLLYPIIAELRVFKTDYELELMRYASKIGSDAHKVAMKTVKPGMYEYQLESVFRHSSYFNGGCRHLAYTCIAACGCDASILHYGHANAPNDRQILDGDICLIDMGPEYCCYGSDITTSFPANGKFTEKQKIIYNAVLNANQAVFVAAKPGVRWTDMHLLAEKVILGELKAHGVLKGDVNDMMAVRLGAVFQPHGLGHFLGLDVHDCGGYLGDALPRSTEMGLKSLRTTRTLQERMVITIEPGCYFIDTLLDKALADPDQSKFIVPEKLAEFRGFGGVRIEDDVVIWANGNENMSRVPRTVEEIEAFMASA